MRIKLLIILAIWLLNPLQGIAQNQEKIIQKFVNELCDKCPTSIFYMR